MGHTPSPGCQLGPTPQSISQCHSMRHIKKGLALNSLHLFFKELTHKPKYLISSSKWLHILQLTQAHKCANNSSRPRKRQDGFQAEGTNTEVCKARGVFQESKKVVWLQLQCRGWSGARLDWKDRFRRNSKGPQNCCSQAVWPRQIEWASVFLSLTCRQYYLCHQVVSIT